MFAYFKLVSSMNSKFDAQQQIPQERLKRQFDKWWPELKDRFDKINPMQESGNVAGLPWLFSLQDMRNIQAYHAQCRLLWIIAPELLDAIADKTDDIINNMKRGINYVYIFPDQNAANDTGEGELRRIIERTNAASLVIRKTPHTLFNSLAVSNYIIVNPDYEEPAFPLRMFIQLPIEHNDQYWIEVERTAAIKFVERFRDVANAVMQSVSIAPAASPNPSENHTVISALMGVEQSTVTTPQPSITSEPLGSPGAVSVPTSVVHREQGQQGGQ